MEAYALEHSYHHNADTSSQLTFDKVMGQEDGAAAREIQKNAASSQKTESLLPKVLIDKGGKQGRSQTTEIEGDASGNAGESKCGDGGGGRSYQPLTGSDDLEARPGKPDQPVNPDKRNEKQQNNSDNQPESSIPRLLPEETDRNKKK
ncbi:MAG: hypothetical protein KC777_15135 [Cyanobacteria bacterium HKST-UBA02]|nr:hypothetical protein [Cyanobacteria bacterium HKST-UBA02]